MIALALGGLVVAFAAGAESAMVVIALALIAGALTQEGP
jgi:hypothetical protein